jgi:hypothetical protein
VQKPVQICHKVCAKTLGTNHLKVAFSLPETDPNLVIFLPVGQFHFLSLFLCCLLQSFEEMLI